MIMGFSLAGLVAVHTAASVIGLLSGALALRAMLASRAPAGLTALFLASTTVTSMTAFMFPSRQLGLGHAVGAVSLLVLAPTILAVTVHHLAGAWRWIYAVGATAALWLNVVIGVLQLFAKLPALRPEPPLLTAPSFLVAQLLALLAFLAVGARAVRRFHPEATTPGTIWSQAGPRTR